MFKTKMNMNLSIRLAHTGTASLLVKYKYEQKYWKNEG